MGTKSRQTTSRPTNKQRTKIIFSRPRGPDYSRPEHFTPFSVYIKQYCKLSDKKKRELQEEANRKNKSYSNRLHSWKRSAAARAYYTDILSHERTYKIFCDLVIAGAQGENNSTDTVAKVYSHLQKL
jgi:hypothetical protein